MFPGRYVDTEEHRLAWLLMRILPNIREIRITSWLQRRQCEWEGCHVVDEREGAGIIHGAEHTDKILLYCNSL